MTIKFKLVGGALTICMLLLITIAVAQTTFMHMSEGFEKIIRESDVGVQSAQHISSLINTGDTKLSEISNRMDFLSQEMSTSKQTVKM